MNTTKSFNISKQLVWEAYKRIKSNQGGCGIDKQSITKFEENLKGNLYKLWNRLASGSYFPQPVRKVEIPKIDGKTRILGIPTVSDRIAQMVVKLELEPEIELYFLPNSYGYRPNKSAIDAVNKARQNCWKKDWVIDLDIQGFFDNMDHELLMRAVRKHTDCKWKILYIDRWLKVPIQAEDGSVMARDKGTPQGGVISPLLANLFMHYAFDAWIERSNPQLLYERYADDIIIHCNTQQEANTLLQEVKTRLLNCKLEVHPEKTAIVYCKDGQRKQDYANKQFDFLGFTFQARTAKSRWGKLFSNFSPAASNKATKKIRKTVRTWGLPKRTGHNIEELAQIVNPTTRGWINYYGSFYKSKLAYSFGLLDYALVRWAKKKYKRLKGSQRNATRWLKRIAAQEPNLFVHGQFTYQPNG